MQFIESYIRGFAPLVMLRHKLIVQEMSIAIPVAAVI
jgi:hypothetical protein